MTTEDEATIPPGWCLHSIDGKPPQLMLVLAVDTPAEARAAMAELAAPFVVAFAQRVSEWATQRVGVGMRTEADREYQLACDEIHKQRMRSLPRLVSAHESAEEMPLLSENDWKFERMLAMASEPPPAD